MLLCAPLSRAQLPAVILRFVYCNDAARAAAGFLALEEGRL